MIMRVNGLFIFQQENFYNNRCWCEILCVAQHRPFLNNRILIFQIEGLKALMFHFPTTVHIETNKFHDEAQTYKSTGIESGYSKFFGPLSKI